ncbi:MAG TPA: hypothetical protein VG187_00605 [Mycobacterium sp.]|nr:hypothetical protein [Mycobacterium sp.]
MPLTQPLPFTDADGDDGVTAELLGLAEVAGFVLFDAPHAATDNAVAPATPISANRVGRADGKVAGIPDI